MSLDDHRRREERVTSEDRGLKTELRPNGGAIPLDDILAMLTNSKRRAILYYLRDNEVASLEELARQIAALETGSRPGDAPPDAVESATAELIHNHLPRLADMLVVEFDDRSLTVRWSEPPTLLDAALTVVEKLDRTTG